MKTLEEIRKETEDRAWTTFESMMVVAVECDDYKLINKLINEFAVNVAKEALKNASDKSQLMMYYIDEEDTTNVDILNFKHRRIQSCYAVPKQSILNESNIPNL